MSFMKKITPKKHIILKHALGVGIFSFLMLSVNPFISLHAPITVTTAQAQRAAPIIIRDSEIEDWLLKWSRPVIEAAGLKPNSINFILIQSDQLNAFVAGGQNIFINTGLLQKAGSVDEVIGVIAHELGHIRGGHLIRGYAAMERAGYETILGTILGIGTAVITGSGQAGLAVSAGMNSVAMGNFLSFSRVQESSADQAALTYLEKAQMSPQGLITFMGHLADQELIPSSQQSEYYRTHPLTSDRLESLQAGLEKSHNLGKSAPSTWNDDFKRMKAKLTGYIHPERIEWDYGSHDKSIYGQYARAISLYRRDHVNEALKEVDGLIATEPQNPYFYELKGQMLVAFGRVQEALPVYEKAVAYAPRSGLIRTAYGHALIESAKGADEAKLSKAIEQLSLALEYEPRSTYIYRLLATAFGRAGDDGAAKVFLAEESLLKGDKAGALRQAKGALSQLPNSSKFRLRALDIISYIEKHPEKG
jgi:predicted Zn-dependent protease